MRQIRIEVYGIALLQGISFLADTQSQLATNQVDELDAGVLMQTHLRRRQRLKLGVIGVESPLDSRKIQALEVEGYFARVGFFREALALLTTDDSHNPTFLTYDRHGHKRLDLPQLAGAYGSGMISAFWLPKGYSPLVEGVQAGHAQFGFVAGIHLIQEFSPEIKRTGPFSKVFNRGSGETK